MKNITKMPIIGTLTTKEIEYTVSHLKDNNNQSKHTLPKETYSIVEIQEHNGHTYYITNQWYKEYKGEPQIIVDELVEEYTPANGMYNNGGAVKFYNKDNEHRLGRPSGSIEKELLDKVHYDSIKQDFVGSFGWKTIYDKLGDGYLYKLDDYDQDLMKSIPLKPAERIYRYINRTTAIGGMSPLIKMNIEKGLLYFPIHNEADDIIFETRGVKALWISLIEDKYVDGGGVGGVRLWDEVSKKLKELKSQDYVLRHKEDEGRDWQNPNAKEDAQRDLRRNLRRKELISTQDKIDILKKEYFEGKEGKSELLKAIKFLNDIGINSEWKGYQGQFPYFKKGYNSANWWLKDAKTEYTYIGNQDAQQLIEFATNLQNSERYKGLSVEQIKEKRELERKKEEIAKERARLREESDDNKWIVKYISTDDDDVASVWVIAESREDAIDQAEEDNSDIGEIKSVEKSYSNGGGVGSDKWQIKNSNDRYYSVSMQTGNPVFNESPDLGYSYKKEEAEQIKNKLLQLGYNDLQVVEYNPNWWKAENGMMMANGGTIKESIDLFFQEGGSDKEYHIQLVDLQDGTYVVNFQYGRRGSSLQSGTKTTTPVPLAQAEKIYASLKREKMAKGYAPNAPTGSVMDNIYQQVQQIPLANKQVYILPQLLNPVEDAEMYINDDSFLAQEKKDYERRIIISDGKGNVMGLNKKGQQVPVPKNIANSIKNECTLDGEISDDVYYVFDILSFEGKDLKSYSATQRLEYLSAMDFGNSVEVVETAYTTGQKRDMIETLKAERREGIVFKKKSAPYTPGRPNSGGNQLKFKFYKTATFIVANETKDKRSVGLELIDDNTGQKIFMGKVTIPPNYDVPAIGDLVEVRYLYAYRGGAVYQPTYLGKRNDSDLTDATMKQIIYKADED